MSTSRSASLPNRKQAMQLHRAPATEDFVRRARLTQPNDLIHNPNFLCMSGMYGGKLYVPPDAYTAFLTHVAKDLSTPGNRLFLVQYVHCSKHNLFFDFDKSGVEEGVMAQQVLPIVQRVVRSLVPQGVDATCFLLSARMQTVRYGDAWECTTHTHSPQGGFHIVFPRVVVDCVRAAVFSVRLINALNEELPDTNWDEVVDLCLSQKTVTSLRMAGMHKAKECGDCRAGKTCLASANDQVVCQKNGPKSRCSVPKVYVVIAVLDGQGRSREETVAKCDNDWLYVLQQCSIEPRPNSLPVELENGDGGDGSLFQHPSVDKAIRVLASSKAPLVSAQNMARAAVQGNYVPTKRVSDAESTDVGLSPTARNALVSIMESHCEAWRNMQFRRVVRPVGQHLLLLYPHCKFCMYANRYHNNNIFFELTPTKFLHKCFSLKCKGHKPSEQVAITLPLPSDEVLAELFPSYKHDEAVQDEEPHSMEQARLRVKMFIEQRYGRPEDRLALAPRPRRYRPFGLDLNTVSIAAAQDTELDPGSAEYHADDSHADALADAEAFGSFE